MEATLSSETSVLTRATRRHIPEDGILLSYRRETLKFYRSIHLRIGGKLTATFMELAMVMMMIMAVITLSIILTEVTY
jgi:hypothetical protein